MTEETKKRHTGKFSDAEVELVKSTFRDNDELLKAVRKVMLQLPLSALDQSMIQVNFKSKGSQLFEIFKKVFLLEIEGNEAILTPKDMWAKVDLVGYLTEQAMPVIKSNAKLIEYITQQLKELDTGKKRRKIVFKDLTEIGDKVDWEIFVDVLTYKAIVVWVEQCLSMFFSTANPMPPKTEAEQLKDSTK